MRTHFLSWLTMAMLVFSISCKKEPALNKAQQTAIHYLFQPALICDTFSKMIWHHDIDFRGLDVEKGLLYFLVKKELSKPEMLKLLTLDSSKIEYAPCETGICEFGGMRGRIDGYYAFRIPATNLRVDTNRMLSYRYYGKSIPVSFKELMLEMDTSIYYHTDKDVDLSPYFKEETYAANVASYISLKGKDPIVRALAEKITTGLKTAEEKAQALLNFVTSQIDYSYEDHWYETEVCKRAHEVLLSGDGDCSGKTTLLASLLEECDIPYCLLYFENHINIGLSGKYPKENGYHTRIKDIDYVMAETTLDSFVIGKTMLSNPEIINEVLFYQNPRQSPFIFDAKTGRKYSFVKLEE